MYHYVRNNEEYEYDIFGRRREEFISQVEFINKSFKILNPNDKEEINYYLRNSKESAFLMTFDDGYKDHIFCSEYLNSLNLNGLFFPPSNIFKGELLDVNGIHFLIGQRNIKISKLLKFIVETIKRKEYKVSLNNRYISVEEYLKHKFDSRFDSKEILIIKRLLQRDIVGLKNRNEIIANAIKFFTNFNSKDLAKNLYISLEEMLYMKNMGMVFGSHGLTHRWLNSLSYDEQYQEINQSFIKLEEIKVLDNLTPRVLCYPYGAFNGDTIAINKLLKVDYGFTTEVGPAKLTKEETFYKLKRWDTNDFWDSKWKRPDSSCIKNI